MKIARVLVIWVIACAFIAPEIRRYAGERRLYRLTGAMQIFSTSPALLEQRNALLLRLSDDAARVATYPADWRPKTLAGAACMQAGAYRLAATLFESALLTGERPELDINLGLALLSAGDRSAALRSLVRGVWISPAVAASLPPAVANDVSHEVDRLTALLRAGQLRPDDLARKIQ
jgi:tetratricopeptide (TPR) repeat protein